MIDLCLLKFLKNIKKTNSVNKKLDITAFLANILSNFEKVFTTLLINYAKYTNLYIALYYRFIEMKILYCNKVFHIASPVQTMYSV